VSGKIAAATAALVISSSSLAGLVYTGIVSVRFEETGVFRLFDAFDRTPVRAGVVPDAPKDEFASVGDLPSESDGSHCRKVDGPGGCVLLFSSGELNLKFFGYTVSLPADWYSYIHDDYAYGVGREGRLLGVAVNPRHTGAAGNDDEYDDVQRVNDNDYVPSPGIATHLVDSTAIGGSFELKVVANDNFQLPPIQNDDVGPTDVGGSPVPSIFTPGDSIPLSSSEPAPFEPSASIPFAPKAFTHFVASGSVPEPSTWAMLLAGFTGLGFASYRKRRRGKNDLIRA
jgi:PEP-CTERM motif